MGVHLLRRSFELNKIFFYQVSESPVASVCSLMTKVKMKFCLTHEGITRSRLPAFTRMYTDKTSICIIGLIQSFKLLLH